MDEPITTYLEEVKLGTFVSNTTERDPSFPGIVKDKRSTMIAAGMECGNEIVDLGPSDLEAALGNT
jgi:hypothetical protein